MIIRAVFLPFLPPFFHLELGGGLVCVTLVEKLRTLLAAGVRHGFALSRAADQHLENEWLWGLPGPLSSPLPGSASTCKKDICAVWDGIGMKSMEYRVDVRKCKHVKML